jgi:hypothetical protein
MAAPMSRQTSQMSPYLVGNKVYGGGRSFPTMGPVDKLGYRERDAKTKSRRDALLRRMKLNVKGSYANPESWRKV